MYIYMYIYIYVHICLYPGERQYHVFLQKQNLNSLNMSTILKLSQDGCANEISFKNEINIHHKSMNMLCNSCLKEGLRNIFAEQ